MNELFSLVCIIIFTACNKQTKNETVNAEYFIQLYMTFQLKIIEYTNEMYTILL
jgi:hypothetical protein